MARHLDFTVMYAAHDAFRRDTDRLRDAAAAGAGADPAVLKGWRTFRRELYLHHLAEDTALWPRLRAALSELSGPDAPELSVLDAMEAEHQRLDSLLDGVEEAMTGGDRTVLAQRAEGLAIALDDHLEHEEEQVLPLIQAAFSDADWQAFQTAIRRLHGLRGGALFVPWLLDGTPLSEQRRVLSLMPAPVRLVYRAIWRPRYLGLRLWAFPAS